jgi:hypothetical protein
LVQIGVADATEKDIDEYITGLRVASVEGPGS